MEILSTKSRSSMVIRAVSLQAWDLATHFAGRTLLCGGLRSTPCPLCEVERPKRRLYFIGQEKLAKEWSLPLLCEFGQEVLLQLQARGFKTVQAAGFAFRLERRTDRPGWKVVDDAIQEVVQAEGHMLPHCVETLFGLQLTINCEDSMSVGYSRDEFINLHRKQILKRAAWHCQKDSHGFV